ncbi:hypothetical protein [Scytonema sp. UIC 10036]|uniref:hypothetical protein n=1 Tax=Scytonema sp. UIC 10036 TaxID=2304196 RepID=UPI001A9AED31|nr:hypothetical protein [Scytonema sp. UIC 10036]
MQLYFCHTSLTALSHLYLPTLQAAERLIATALSGNPPTEIAEELKDLFIQINLHPYLQRHGISIDNEQINALILKNAR